MAAVAVVGAVIALKYVHWVFGSAIVVESPINKPVRNGSREK